MHMRQFGKIDCSLLKKTKSNVPPGSFETARHSAQAKGGGSCALPGQSAKNSSYSMDSKYKPD